jgi:hypothetical protein
MHFAAFCTLFFFSGGHSCRNMSVEPLFNLDLPGVRKLKSGKVREVFDLGDLLLIVATGSRRSTALGLMGFPKKGKS